MFGEDFNINGKLVSEKLIEEVKDKTFQVFKEMPKEYQTPDVLRFILEECKQEILKKSLLL